MKWLSVVAVLFSLNLFSQENLAIIEESLTDLTSDGEGISHVYELYDSTGDKVDATLEILRSQYNFTLVFNGDDEESLSSQIFLTEESILEEKEGFSFTSEGTAAFPWAQSRVFKLYFTENGELEAFKVTNSLNGTDSIARLFSEKFYLSK
ncbi:MAG: hypothetical protein H6621_03885 [Halobacteriovoraceae bacterium]|nr:hypothetical protein [Halobacteriovoraceae bacterium]